MSNRAKGVIVGVSLSLLTMAIWIFGPILLGYAGFIFAAALLGIVFILPYKKICPEDKSKFPVIFACITIVVVSLISEFLYWVIIYALKDTLPVDFYGEDFFVLINSFTFSGYLEWIALDYVVNIIIGLAAAFAAFGVLQYTLSRRTVRGTPGYTYHTNVNNQQSGYNNGGNYYPGNSQSYDPFGNPQQPRNPQNIDPFADAPQDGNIAKPLTDTAQNVNDRNSFTDTRNDDSGDGGKQWFEPSGSSKQWFEPSDDDDKN